MSIQYTIPKTSRFLQLNAAVTALFNVPTLGKYDFNSQAATILPLERNSIYLLERINVGGTIPEEEYLFAQSTLPEAVFFLTTSNIVVYPKPLPVVNFIDNQEVNAFFWSDQNNVSLQVKLSGTLSQTPFLVGVASVKINIQCNVYEISDNDFVASFKAANQQTGVGFRTAPAVVPMIFDVDEPRTSRRRERAAA